MEGENKMEQYFFTVSTLIPKSFFSLANTPLVIPGKLSLGATTSTNQRVHPEGTV